MASTNLTGPYSLDDKTINDVITRVSPGTYVLGYIDTNNAFIVEYVGRSDSNVNERLHNWVDKGYQKFKFGYFDSPKAAFERECTIYHDFGGASNKLDNKSHPDRPNNTNWQCPKCDIFKAGYGW